MARFFISYCRKDGNKIATALYKSISGLDFKHHVFLDQKSIEAGANWVNNIEDRINDCEYFILVLSEMSLNSKWVEKEVELVKKSESLTGMRKLFVIKDPAVVNPAYLPNNLQILKTSEDWCVDFYRLMSGIFSNPTFYGIKEEVKASEDDFHTVWLSVKCEDTYLGLIDSVEYRFDNGFSLKILDFEKVILKRRPEKNFRIKFYTNQTVTIFVVIYLKNTKQINIIHEVKIG